MDDKYTAEYIGKDGSQSSVKGTLAECSNWADNIIRSRGEGTVIVRKDEK